MTIDTPDISIVIPIHNEEGILVSAVNDLVVRLPALEKRYEIILAENGSADCTVEIAEMLCEKYPEVSVFSSDTPNYGAALKEGIRRARGTFVLCDEIDICDVDFYSRALEILEKGDIDLVVGSKAMPGANDKRPFTRRMATSVINRLLRLTLEFKGTDTHGLKAFRREVLLPVVEECVVDRDLFDTGVDLGHLGGIQEIPVTIVEKRTPSIDLFRRVPAVVKGLGRLFVAIRLGR